MEEPSPGHFTVKVLVGKWEFSSCLNAASDLERASPDAEQEQACKCDMTAQDTPIWLPAVRLPLGPTGWEGDAPVTDAFPGGKEGLGQGQAQAHTCRQALTAQCCANEASNRTNPLGSHQHHQGWVLDECFGKPCPALSKLRLQQPWQPPCPESPLMGCPVQWLCPAQWLYPVQQLCPVHLYQFSPLRIKQLFANLN